MAEHKVTKYANTLEYNLWSLKNLHLVIKILLLSRHKIGITTKRDIFSFMVCIFMSPIIMIAKKILVLFSVYLKWKNQILTATNKGNPMMVRIKKSFARFDWNLLRSLYSTLIILFGHHILKVIRT